MTARRCQFGRCSFVPPEGFILESGASRNDFSDTACGCESTLPPVCLTLSAPRVRPVVPEISENPEHLISRAYPVVITLTTQVAPGLSPLDFLGQTITVLQDSLDGFNICYCRETRIGHHPAAASEYSFQSVFRLHHLSLAWHMGLELATATLAVPTAGVEKSWEDLRRFAESVRLITCNP